MLQPHGPGRQHPLHRLQQEQGLSLHCREKKGREIFLKKVIGVKDTESFRTVMLETRDWRDLGQKLQLPDVRWPQGHRVLGHSKACLMVLMV